MDSHMTDEESEMEAPRYTQSRTAFSMTTAVTVDIQASPDIVWTILTNAKEFPRWNSTVSGIEGEIREGERLRVHAPGTKRTFTPKVSDVAPNQHMTWASGASGIFRGVRTFELHAVDGSTGFTMTERFSGLMFALARRSLPDFRPIFEAYAADLKREAERVAGAKEGQLAETAALVTTPA